MDITERVIARVAEYKEIDASEIVAETTIESLDMDSLDALNLIFELEEEFDLTIPDEEALEMKTIQEMSDGVKQLLEMKERGEELPKKEDAESDDS